MTFVEELELYKEEFDIDLNGYGEIVPEEERACTCCFTGHRVMSKSQRSEVLYRLRSTILYFVSKGVVNFRAGGALGFDTMAAASVLIMKNKYPNVRLDLILPCETQTSGWHPESVKLYEEIKKRADNVSYVSTSYFRGVMQKRNRALVDGADVCVAFLRGGAQGGTGYTVSYAQKKGVRVINLWEKLSPNTSLE